MTVKPNFFIIGAPKCGTTALSEYMKTHPNVFISDPKEPHFFSTDLATRHAIRDEREYLNCFSGVGLSHSAIGEASVGYLYSDVAVPKILGYSPDARFIVMLRNPSELAHSWHSEALYNGYELEKDFETAWHLQDKRKKGLHIPNKRDGKLLMYYDMAALGTQIENLFEHLPRNRVHVIFFDDFKNNTLAAYEGVLRFLDLPSDGRSEFPVINQSKFVRSSALMELSHLVAQFKKKMGVKGGFGILEKINVPRKSRADLHAEFRQELVECFRYEVEKLEKIFGKNLSSWK